MAGPVALGAVVISPGVGSAPKGLRDSKLLTAKSRSDLLPAIYNWVLDYSVGFASAAEIDQFGIVGAMRLAGMRSLDQLSLRPEMILLDGSHDYISGARANDAETLFETDEMKQLPPVITKVKADMSCAGVAAASIVAKCSRDAFMVQIASQFPGYSFDRNKGYSSPDHIVGLRTLGLTSEHRQSWKMPV